MALSEIKRQRIRHTKEVLESIKEENILNNEKTHIDEAVEGKFRDINDVEEYLNNRQFGYIEMNKFDTAAKNMYGHDDFNVSVFFMSNKNTEVKENDDNYISLSFKYDDSYEYVEVADSRDRNTTLEKFIELPVNVEGDTEEKIRDVVKKCDTHYIYDLYLEDALRIVSDSMNTAYQLFKSPNFYKTIDKRLAPTLAVTYSAKLKKYIFFYNPDFILEAALEEWMKCKSSYESLRSCYVYLLAYFITHEMMHIIYNNTSSDEGGGVSDIELSDDAGTNHTITNMVQDCFINSELAIRFKRASGKFGIRKTNNLAPIPKIGIDSRLCLRGQHNEGFKEYKTQKELVESIFNLYVKTAKLEGCGLRSNYNESYDLTKFKGADIYVLVDVDPRSRDIRQSSIVFQKFLNDLVRLITDGNIYDRFSQFTEEEKVSDKGILPNGSFVRIKNTVDICVVVGYDEDTGLYTLNKTNSTLVKKDLGDGTFECSYKYSDSEVSWGKSKRGGFIPFDENSYDNTWIEGAQKDEKRQLDDEDLREDDDKGTPPPMPMPMPMPMPPMPDMGGKQKLLKIGDIVYIRTAGVFGRITDIKDGRFELEEMKEENARIIDDSLFHK